MAKPSRSQEVREKAQQLREQQARADRRTRNIIIGLVVLILVVIIGAIAAVIIQSNHKYPRWSTSWSDHRCAHCY